MNKSKILNQFAVLADITPLESQNWEFLADESIAFLSELTPADKHNCNEFISACASVCFYRYIIIIAARGELDTMSTSDMSIKSNANDKINYAKMIYQQSLNTLGISIPEHNFYFGIM